MNLKTQYLKYIILPLLFLLVIGMNQAFSQNKITVKGTVTNINQESLIGVTVVVEADKSGTITDLNGNFSLSCIEGTSLKISYIGHKTQVLPAKPEMEVVLETDDISLEGVTVVAVGYGTMRKSDLTGAISSVKSENFRQGVVNSNEQLLQGKVAGLTVISGGGNPAAGSSMRLRGGTSLSASNGPLVVIDGVPGVDINSVQSNEIVSFDVLKDASAAAIYGSRGANGVIIITTNRENKGKSLEYNTYFAVGKVAKNLDLLSADQWRQYVRDNDVKSAVDYGANTDWQKELEQTSYAQSHNVSFSSGGEKSGLRASFNYLNTDGVIKKSYMNRMGASVTGYQYGLNNKLKVELSLHANTDKWSDIDNSMFVRAYNLNPTIPVMQNGKYTQIGGTNNNNPVEILENRTDDKTRKRVLGYGKAELEIIEGLKAVANVSYEFNSSTNGYYLPSYSFNGITDKGYGSKTSGEYYTAQLETYLSYERQFSKDVKLNLLGGYSYLDNVYSGFGSQRRGFDTDEFGYNNLAAGQDYRAGDVYSYKGEAKLISFYGRMNLNLKERYLLTATVRDDGSSRFGANNKWGIFPSVSLGWRVTEEAFMEGTKGWLNNLKIRAGYGVTGNQDGIGEYKITFPAWCRWRFVLRSCQRYMETILRSNPESES
jgi:iron complex outermembrane receptor protein